jgi:hypothetical protein
MVTKLKGNVGWTFLLTLVGLIGETQFHVERNEFVTKFRKLEEGSNCIQVINNIINNIAQGRNNKPLACRRTK